MKGPMSYQTAHHRDLGPGQRPTQATPPGDLLGMGEVARRLGISYLEVQHLIWSRQLPAQEVGPREYYVWRQDFERLRRARLRGQS